MNPIKALIQSLEWTTQDAARNLRLEYDNMRRIIKGAPVELPDGFKLRLMRYLGMNLDAVDALNEAYIAWRNNDTQNNRPTGNFALK
ncbi:MAG TPA: hypothetical protein DD856_07415 [Sulfobacillus sp.]|nr:hypothetical protein [Sulfobacillus sp.]